MKKLICLFLIVSVFTGCSTDDDSFEPPEEPIIEEPVDEDDDTGEDDGDDEDDQSFILQPEDTRTYMVDAGATAETAALFYQLKTISRTNFIVGQQDAFNAFYGNNRGESDMKKTTGSDPGMLGSDFMFITDDQNNEQPNNWFYQQEQIIIADAVEAYNKGMINTFSWHLREPYEGKHFYASDMTAFQRENAFKSILPGGANHDWYKKKLQKVAEVTQNIVGSDGSLSPVIFRPFHEFDGDWFWWGAAYSTPEEFKTAWRFTVEYLRDELGVHNLLYAYSPDNSYTTSGMYLQRYPGDAYVDILGMDNYGDLERQDGSRIEIANSKLKMVSDLAVEKVKIAALTETGYFVDGENPLPSNFFSEKLYEVLTGDDMEIGYMMFWQNYENVYTVPPPGQDGAEDFVDFAQQEEPILLEGMSDFYNLPN